MLRMPRITPKAVPVVIRREIHEDKLPGGFVTVDYSEIDGSGCFMVFGVYHPKRKVLYHAKIETTGRYNRWTDADILHQLT